MHSVILTLVKDVVTLLKDAATLVKDAETNAGFQKTGPDSSAFEFST